MSAPLPPGVWMLPVVHEDDCPTVDSQDSGECTCPQISFGQPVPYMEGWSRVQRRKAAREAEKAARRARR